MEPVDHHWRGCHCGEFHQHLLRGLNLNCSLPRHRLVHLCCCIPHHGLQLLIRAQPSKGFGLGQGLLAAHQSLQPRSYRQHHVLEKRGPHWFFQRVRGRLLCLLPLLRDVVSRHREAGRDIRPHEQDERSLLMFSWSSCLMTRVVSMETRFLNS